MLQTTIMMRRREICMCARFRRCNESNELFQLIVITLPLTQSLAIRAICHEQARFLLQSVDITFSINFKIPYRQILGTWQSPMECIVLCIVKVIIERCDWKRGENFETDQTAIRRHAYNPRYEWNPFLRSRIDINFFFVNNR